MQIKIAERLRPFTHIPGTFFILPKSSYRLQIFPALMIIHDLSEAEPILKATIPVPVKGPLKEFTAQLDLEKGAIHIWGEDTTGYFRYLIFYDSHQNAISIELIKGLTIWPSIFSIGGHGVTINILSSHQKILPIAGERLSLGNHKSQDWDGVKKRASLMEIFPFWLCLGQQIKNVQEVLPTGGTLALLKRCQQASKTEAYEAFKNLFKIAFEGILSPCLHDIHHQGIDLPPVPSHLSPLSLLSEGAKAIRSLFIRHHQKELFILPSLPPEFHCGRYLRISCDSIGFLDLEWTKKKIRRVLFHSKVNGPIKFHFPKDVKHFRLNGHPVDLNDSLHFIENETYIFDRFQG